MVVYDPDSALVCDIVSCEDAYQSERVGAALLIEDAKPGQLWMADRHFCTRTLLCGIHNRQAHFIVREHEKPPKLLECGSWGKTTDIDTGRVREQSIVVTDPHEPVLHWRRIEIELNTPTEDGDTHVQLWSNLPGHVDAVRIAALYRKRWRIENLFQRLESVLHSEIRSLGHPRAALLGFATAVLAYNVLALLKRVIEQAHQDTHPALDVSTYHLAVEITRCYEALSVALPPAHLPGIKGLSPSQIMQRLLQLAARLRPKQLASSKRKPKPKLPKGYVDASIA